MAVVAEDMTKMAAGDQDLSKLSVRNQVSDAEWRLRVDLAATYRLVALYGWDDLIATHISVRIPGPDHHFLINPVGIFFNEITASSLIKIDLEGRAVMDTPFMVNPAGFTIHSAIHMAREDAHCVLHLHTADGCAVSAQAEGLLPLTQHAMQVMGDLAYHDYEGVAVDLSERERLAQHIGDKHCVILRNHGTLTMGKTCGDAFLRVYYLERACTMQVRAMTGKLNMPNQGVPEHVYQQTAKMFDGPAGLLAWPGLLRQIDREDTSYRH